MDVFSIDDIYLELSKELNSVDSLIFDSLSEHDEAVKSIGNYVVAAGGKRIRPLFNLMFSRIFNYTGKDNIAISAAIEFFHTATLLHDDVIDESSVRRGKEAAHKKWGSKYAILVGDFLFSKAFKLMISTNSIEVLNVLSNAATIISEGEVKQLKNLHNINLEQNVYIEILRSKTAELFAVASKTAAIISNQPEGIKNASYEFGINFGIAFQIIDDILDYTNTSSGKDIGKDFFEGKVTLPVITLLGLCDTEESDFVKRIFSNFSRSSEDFTLLKDKMNKYEALNLSKSVALEYLLAARKIYEASFRRIDKNGFISVLVDSYINHNSIAN